jgi:beta-N-acetylhexosaminidase
VVAAAGGSGVHFPGLGSATKAQNTDAGPVTLNVSLSSLRARDEASCLAAGIMPHLAPPETPPLPAGSDHR